MKILTFARNTKTVLPTIAFLFALLSTTALPILMNPPAALAGSNNYPTSIAGCKYVSGTPSGYYTCDLKDDAQDTWFDPWLEENRECTSYAAWMLHSVSGFEMPFNDDAVNWGPDASSRGYHVDMTPAVGSIYWSSGSDHVAWVESVSSDGNTITTEDYNSGFPTNPGLWAEHTGVATSSASGYIHFKDVSTSTPGKGGGNASSWVSNRLDGWIAQATPTNGSNIGHIYVDSSWHPWETIYPPLPQLMASQPAVVSWALNRIDIFARSQTGSLIHAWLDSNSHTWNGWEDKGGCIIGAPTVTTWGVNRLDIFAEGCNATGPNLYHIWLGGTPVAWHDWELISTAVQRMASPPSAVSWGPNRLDILAQGDDSTLLHTYIDTSWHDWDSRGGCVIGQPAVSSWASGRLDGFAQSCNSTGGNFVHIWFDANTWHTFDVVPNSSTNIRINGVLGATSWANSRIDMFTRSSTNSLTHWWFDGAWEGPEDKGGSIATF